MDVMSEQAIDKPPQTGFPAKTLHPTVNTNRNVPTNSAAQVAASIFAIVTETRAHGGKGVLSGFGVADEAAVKLEPNIHIHVQIRRFHFSKTRIRIHGLRIQACEGN